MPRSNQPLVSIIMGSDSDLSVMKEATEALDRLMVDYELRILSAHRTPDELTDYAKGLEKRGVRVVIAGAGAAAHLGGVIAAHCVLPVIGVPVPSEPFKGLDSLYSIVQMPKGVPVACVAVGNAWNAGLLAAQILGAAETKDQFRQRLRTYKEELRKAVLEKDKKIAR